LVRHNGACISHYWANWDLCNMNSMLAIGVLADDRAIYNEAVDYFKNGGGTGSIGQVVVVLHPGNLGQWQESGRDQEHAQLGIGELGVVCQVAWNQGLDLFGYSSSRLLAGAEYVSKTNLSEPMPYTMFSECTNVNQYYISKNSSGRLDDRPVWELVYNHYAVLQGLSAPNTKKMAALIRPEHGSTDHFGYGTLTFTLNSADSPYPASPVAPAPTGVTTESGVGRITVKWAPSAGDTANGYNVKRATTSGGPYTSLSSWTANTYPAYTDTTVVNGTTYYYVVAANNPAGSSGDSAQVSGKAVAAGALPSGWASQDIGSVGTAGSASYANVTNGTFIVAGAGTTIDGAADSFNFTSQTVTGDATITARVYGMSGTLLKTGVMIRESLATNASTLIMKVGDVGWRVAEFGTRASTNGTMTWAGGNQYSFAPVWFRLQRSGNTFTGSQSDDGVTWFTVGTSTVTMAVIVPSPAPGPARSKRRGSSVNTVGV